MSNPHEMNNDSPAMQELRQLLFQKEADRIAALEELLNNQELHAKEIAKVLAEAVQLRSKEDSKLGQALGPAVEDALKSSIARNPKPISDALFPVMGPAIRKAINNSIASMLQSLNQTLEHSFSAQGLRWRLDALRTGKSFAEIVVLNTLVYRVEQVFLIHKETGLLLQHLSYDPSLNEDADVVSSMLTAVRDFIQDSFASSGGQEVENLRLGDLEIIVEQGPDIVLAVVCRGNTPRSLHSSISPIIEEIQYLYHDDLQEFDGDSSKFDDTNPILATLMVADYANQNKASSPIKAIVAVGLLVAGAIGWLAWNSNQQHEVQQRWQTFIEQLNEEPGIIITHVKHDDNQYTLLGLRDPLSIKPETLLAPLGLNKDNLTLKLQPYHALQAPLILQRANKLLQPPESMTLSLENQTLHLSGTAANDWIENTIQTAPFMAGINHVDSSQASPVIPLLDRVTQLLQPPKSVSLTLNDSKLIAKGSATQAWVKQAADEVKKIKEITSYQDVSVTQIDSPAYLLRQARKKLNPPSSVELLVTADKRLIARGYASDEWIQSAHTKANKLRFISAYDDQELGLSDDTILKRAIEQLTPPESVQLSFSNSTLFATGIASQAWITTAQENALQIQGVSKFDDQVSASLDDNAILLEAIALLQPPATVTLTYSEGILTASGSATQFWIENAQNTFVAIEGIHSFYTSKLVNTTQAWLDIQTQINDTTIAFIPTLSQLDKTAEETINTVVDLLQKAIALEPTSYLQISGHFQVQEQLITSLRVTQVKKELIKQGALKKHLKSRTSAANNDSTPPITFSLLSDVQKP